MSRERLQSEVVWKFIIFICIFPIIYRGIFIYMLYIFFSKTLKEILMFVKVKKNG